MWWQLELHRLLTAFCVGLGKAAAWPGGDATRIQREREAVKVGITALVEQAFFGTGEQMSLENFNAWCAGNLHVSRWLSRFCNECVQLMQQIVSQMPQRSPCFVLLAE